VSTGSTILWVIDKAAALTTQELWALTDTVAPGVMVDLVAPGDGFQNPVNPVSGASQDVAFSWEKPTTGTITYQIRIYADAACSAQLLSYTPGPTAAAEPVVIIGPGGATATAPAAGTTYLNFAAGQTYYWKVRTTSPALSPWSEVRSFTIEPLSAQVSSLLSPENGTQNASKAPSFSWAPVSGAKEYRFKLADNVALANAIVDVKVKSTGYALLTRELEEGSTYYWAVMPIAPVEGAWSAIANFTVAEEAVVIPPPPPVKIVQTPPPVINLPEPPPPPADIIIPPAPQPPAPITPAYIWAIIIIGAILVIAVIVLIVRTRRTV
jgi:hypothetical protein